jgi:hypothetical protein
MPCLYVNVLHMLTFEDTVKINADKHDILDWFYHVTERFVQWHPKEHVEVKILNPEKSTTLGLGTKLYVDEYFGKYRMKTTFVVTEARQDEYVGWIAVFPYTLLNSKGDFTISGDKAPYSLRCRIMVGWDNPFGRFLDKVALLLPPIRQLANDMQVHIEIEDGIMKDILEKEAQLKKKKIQK